MLCRHVKAVHGRRCCGYISGKEEPARDGTIGLLLLLRKLPGSLGLQGFPNACPWCVNRKTGNSARRTSHFYAGRFSSTVHGIQGDTLEAAIGHLRDLSQMPSMDDVTHFSVFASRTRTSRTCALLEPVNPQLFQLGAPTGPSLLMKRLRNEISMQDVFAEFDEQARKEQEQQHGKKRSVLDQVHVCMRCSIQQQQIVAKSLVDFVHSNRKGMPSYRWVLEQGMWAKCVSCASLKRSLSKAQVQRKLRENSV